MLYGDFLPADLNIIQFMWIESLKDQIRTNQPSASAHSHKRCLLDEDWRRTRWGGGSVLALVLMPLMGDKKGPERSEKGTRNIPKWCCFWILIQHRPWSLLGVGRTSQSPVQQTEEKSSLSFAPPLDFSWFPITWLLYRTTGLLHILGSDPAGALDPAAAVAASAELNVSPLQF